MLNINVINHQEIDGEKDIIEENALGSCYEKNGKTYILYKTKTELGEVSNILITDGYTVTLKRTGASASTMIFDKKKSTSTVYRMPYGNIQMEITTEKIVNALSNGTGTLKIFYTITMQGQKICNNMRITVS